MSTISIYTDGACKGNQYATNRGGYGAVIINNGKRLELSQGYKNTTNNRMELRGVIAALQTVRHHSTIDLYSDSKYVCEAFTEGWINKWQTNGWKTASKKRVRNIPLWQELIPLAKQHDIKWRWVKAHDGNEENERADRLARLAATSGNLLNDSGPTINQG